ncbi:DUF1983 domain-containing protein [Muribacter muris]|uniref:DUF1983 domain-containing protein n=1 Tax=Muribacter muris TaxID=67855 RepID=A0A4Y9K5J1_9PAST|nr:phage tail protein [Muribacter muris]MBF0784322.1 DUF1983 domain-containing protein [Muribacter muris]MBF0826941.1 DUF1983 domain-containing protein [Muribacter muris]TFV13058.1 DUF1983 domain-containing protein [Muribacter muris]
MSEEVRSKQLVSIVEVISEGEIAGLVDGYRSIYLDNTPIENITRGKNFEKVEVDQRLGQARQSVMSRFGQTEKEISVGTELKHGIPLTRTITDPKVNRVRLTLGVTSLFKQEDDGGDSAQSVDFKITIGQQIEYLTISGKHHSQYLRNIMLGHLPAVPFTIKVERVQPDSDSLRLQNKTLWSAYTEIIDTAFAYPHTALVGIKFDSQYFANIPTRTYDVLGIKVKVPSNYDPIRRIYTGLWDGTFKLAWTNNPAWILYDLVTSKRYGLGQRLGEFGADKWALYQVAQYCDQLIPDGFGGKEPRFTCNVWLTEQRSAYEVINDICSIFRAMPVWNGTELTVIMDRPADPVWTYTAANVIGGFSRQYSAMKARHNAIQVEYLDADNNYEKAIEYVSDDEAIRKYGLNLKKVTAFGCTSRGQAHRTGLWILMTEKLETESITFNVGAEGLMHIPGDIIRVADTQYAGANIGGRVLAVNGRTLTLDREITLSGNSYFQYINGEAKPVNIKISHANGNTVTLDRVPAGLSVNGVWSLTTQQISSQLYRAMTISENEDGSYTIMALQHEPQKEAIVDNGAVFEPRNTTLHRTPRLEHLDVQLDAGSVKFAWQTTSGIGTLTYDVRILKDGKLYAYHKGLTGLELALDDLPDGEYEVVIIAKNAQGQVVSEKTQTFVINRPPVPEEVMVSGGLTDVTLSWKWWDDATQTEIWASETNDILTAKRLAKVLASTYTHNVGPRKTRYYWLRHTRGQNKGLFYQEQGLKAETAVDIDEELRVLNEKLSENIVDKVFDVAAPARGLELVKTVDNLPTEFIGHNTIYVLADGKQYNWNGSAYIGLMNAGDIVPTAQLDTDLIMQINGNSYAISQEVRDRQTALGDEATARTQALQAEATNRTKAIQAESSKLTKALQDEARTRGTAITRLENVDKQQAQQITQVTTKAEQALTGLSAERQARIQGDQAEANAREVLTTRVSAAESGITTLQRSVANQTTALSEVSQTLTAKLDNLQVGGRNLLRHSNRHYTGNRYMTNWPLSKVPDVGEQVTVTLWGELAADRQGFGVYNTHGYRELAKLNKIRDGVYSATFTWRNPLNEREEKDNALSTHLNIYAYPRSVTSDNTIKQVKLEIGNISTDWTPAPEDLDTTVANIGAELTAYKSTQAGKEQAQATQLSGLTSRLGQAEGKITTTQQSLSELNSATTSQLNTLTGRMGNAETSLNTIQQTKASKEEVASLAQQQLQAVWQADTRTAIDGIQVGGRNYLVGSHPVADYWRFTKDSRSTARGQIDGALIWQGGSDSTIKWKQWQCCGYVLNGATPNPLLNTIENGQTFTLSFEAQSSADTRLGIALAYDVTQGARVDTANHRMTITASSQWVKYQFTFTANRDKPAHYKGSRLIFNADSLMAGHTFKLRKIKLEKGTVSTDWTPAPEDTDSDIAKVSANLTVYQQTQATKEAATAQQLTQLNGRVGQAEGGLSDLRQTISNATSATAEQLQTLSASLNNLSVGGRNLLKGSAVPYSADGYSTRYVLTTAPKVGEDVVITLWGDLGEGRTGIGAYNSHGFNEIARLEKIADGVYQGKGKWKKPMNGNTERTPNDTHLNVYFYPREATSTNTIRQIKLEKGTVSTDWTPAPEDTETALTGIRAEVTAASRTVAELNDKVRSTHTIKAQAIAGGRTAIAGIALGATADNRTAESSVIVMADRFGVVKNAQDGTVKPMFNVVNNKVAIHGDLVADGSITATKLAANSVTTGALQAGAVRTEHLAAGQVSADKLAIGLGGNLLVNPTFLPDKDGRPFGWGEHAGGWHNGSLQLGSGGEWLGGNIDAKFERCLNWDRTAPNGYTGWAVCVAQDVSVLPGKRYIFSFYGSLHSGTMRVNAEKTDHTGRYLGVLPAISRHQTQTGAGNMHNGLANATRFSITFVAPDTGRVRLIAGDWGQGRRCLIMMRAMLEEVPDTITQPSPWKPGGLTMIDGGQIITGSVTAQQIAAGSITTNHLTTDAVAANHIRAGAINASHHIQARSIGAEKLNIQSLSAVSANLGHVKSGYIEGTTITGAVINGGTINGGTIKGVHIESATGRFTGALEVTQLIGGNIYEVVERTLQRTGHSRRYSNIRTSYGSHESGTLFEYRTTIHLFPAKSRRLLNIDGYVLESNGLRSPTYYFLNSGSNMFNQTNLDNGRYYDNTQKREFFVHSSVGHISGGVVIIPPNVSGQISIGYWGNGEGGQTFGIKATITVMSNASLINIGL